MKKEKLGWTYEDEEILQERMKKTFLIEEQPGDMRCQFVQLNYNTATLTES